MVRTAMPLARQMASRCSTSSVLRVEVAALQAQARPGEEGRRSAIVARSIDSADSISAAAARSSSSPVVVPLSRAAAIRLCPFAVGQPEIGSQHFGHDGHRIERTLTTVLDHGDDDDLGILERRE